MKDCFGNGVMEGIRPCQKRLRIPIEKHTPDKNKPDDGILGTKLTCTINFSPKGCIGFGI